MLPATFSTWRWWTCAWARTQGLELIPRLSAACPWMKIAVITAYASIDTAVEAMRRGAFDYLPKPFTSDQVNLLMRKVAEVRNLEKKVEALQEALEKSSPEADFTSLSPAMQRTLEMARRVAGSDATLLIRGESGTGKTLLARTIHTWGPRAARPFGVVSCPSLSPELLESELFGHVKGAFTGAVRDNPGRLAACNGGTLFLDEIGDLPLPLAGQAAAGHPGKGIREGGRGRDPEGRRAHDRGHQRRSGPGGARPAGSGKTCFIG